MKSLKACLAAIALAIVPMFVMFASPPTVTFERGDTIEMAFDGGSFVAAAYAQEATPAPELVPPETVEQAVGLLPALLQAALEGKHEIAAGLFIMVLVVGLRQYALPKWNLSADILPFVAAALGVLSFGGLGAAQGLPIGEAMLNGLVAGLLSGGAWSMLGKHLAKIILGDKYVETQG